MSCWQLLLPGIVSYVEGVASLLLIARHLGFRVKVERVTIEQDPVDDGYTVL